MTDPLTGIHEPMVIIPIGMDCREPIKYFFMTKSVSRKEFEEMYPGPDRKGANNVVE